MRDILRAARQILAEALRPAKRTGDVLDIREVADMALRWLSAPSVAGIAYLIQGTIPGIKHLYPWAFPIIAANAALTVLVYIAAVRLQLPRNRSLLRLPELRQEGYQARNAGTQISNPEQQLQPWIDKYHAWEDEVREQLRLVSLLDAKLWDTLGNVPQYYKGEGLAARYLNFFTFQLQRLEVTIERLRH